MMFTLAILLVFREGRLGGKGENGGRGKWGVCVRKRERRGGGTDILSKNNRQESFILFLYTITETSNSDSQVLNQ